MLFWFYFYTDNKNNYIFRTYFDRNKQIHNNLDNKLLMNNSILSKRF